MGLPRSRPELLHPLDYSRNPITMRCPAEQKAETHEKILATAARSFREHGSERNGIGQVRKELELTKGGFYRHFDSKGDLYAAALARAFEELGNRMIAVAEAALEPAVRWQPWRRRSLVNRLKSASESISRCWLFASACFPIFQGTPLTRSERASLFCFPGWLAYWSLLGRLRTCMAVSACWLTRGHSIWRHLARKRAKSFGL